jgi:ketosteroid isomerase-like protein
MSTAVEVVRRLFAAVERRDLPAMLGCYAEDVEIHEAPSLPYGGVYRGHDGAVRHARAFQATWARYQSPAEYPLQAAFADGGDGGVVAVFRHRAADPADGRRIDAEEVGLYRVRADRVVRSQMLHFDTAALLRFLDGADR